MPTPALRLLVELRPGDRVCLPVFICFACQMKRLRAERSAVLCMSHLFHALVVCALEPPIGPHYTNPFRKAPTFGWAYRFPSTPDVLCVAAGPLRCRSVFRFTPVCELPPNWRERFYSFQRKALYRCVLPHSLFSCAVSWRLTRRALISQALFPFERQTNTLRGVQTADIHEGYHQAARQIDE